MNKVFTAMLLVISMFTCASAATVYQYGNHTVGYHIKLDENDVRACVRIKSNEGYAWFVADAYESHEKGVIAEIVVDKFINKEETAVDSVTMKCFSEIADSPVVTKSGKYNIVFPLDKGIVVLNGTLTEGSKYIEAKL